MNESRQVRRHRERYEKKINRPNYPLRAHRRGITRDEYKIAINRRRRLAQDKTVWPPADRAEIIQAKVYYS